MNYPEGGIPMSHGSGDSLPPDTEIDTMLNGGTPNEERIAFEQPSEDPDEKFDPNAEINPQSDTNNQADPNAKQQDPGQPATDPIVAKMQQAIAQLTPQQRSALMSQPVEIVHNGEKMQIPADKQIPLMQMGMNYSEKMRAVNLRDQELVKRQETITQQEKYYGEIENAAKSNPEWWKHVTSSYQAFKLSGKAGNANGDLSEAEMTPALRAALSKVTDLEQKLDGFLSEKTKEADMKRTQAEDAELEQQIQSFSKEYADFDWLTADESGLVLADRITVHGAKNGINNFRAAARDYLFSDIIARKSFKEKEALKGTIQSKTKAGEITNKKRPNALRPPSNLSRGYEDLMNEGYKELG